jgi:hypothetical protein
MPLQQVQFSNQVLVDKSKDDEIQIQISTPGRIRNKKVSVSTQAQDPTPITSKGTPQKQFSQTHYKFF